MSVNDLVLPLVAALWACSSLVFSATLETNKMRDKILFGRDGDQVIGLSHRRHMMRNDWLPLVLCIAGVCVAFAALAAIAPLLLSDNDRNWKTWGISVGVAVCSGVMAVLWVPTGIADWRAMRSALEQAAVEA